MSSLGEKIFNLRTNLNMTQEELATKMGYKSRSTVNKIELGKISVPAKKIEKFAKVLGVTPAYLTGWDDNQPITKSEAELLEVLRRVPEDKRELVKQMALAFAEDQEPH